MSNIQHIAQLTPDPHNANKGTQRGRGMLERSLRENGVGRSILLDRNGKIIAGNKTTEAAADIGIEDVIVVPSDGTKLIAVQRMDLDLDTDPRAVRLAVADNRVAQEDLDWNVDVLKSLSDTDILNDYFTSEELDKLVAASTDEPEVQEEGRLTRWDVPDALWPTNNEWGIPTLDLRWQADAVDAPVLIWGAMARTSKNRGTYAFYTEDARFEALWDDPTPIVNSGCINAVEPNFSTAQQMPRALALYQIYRKRVLARWWQSKGVRIFVDMNVAPSCYDLNMLGVPVGWRAYATRGYTQNMDETVQEYELACQRAETEDILFLVYGGGKEIKQLCGTRGWVWIPEDMDRAKGRDIANGY